MAHFWPKLGILPLFKKSLRQELGLDEDDLPEETDLSPRKAQPTICIHQYDNPRPKRIKRKKGFSTLHIDRQTRHCQQCGAINIRERPRGGSEADWRDILEASTNVH